MLAKKHRLNLSQDENALIFKRNQSFFINSVHFFLYLRKNDSFLKFTCIAPRKKYPRAVARNFYKRQVFTCLEELITDGKIDKKQKTDIVLVLKQVGKEQLSKADFKQEIFQAINRF